eukprot:GILI01001945.1.p1 GENE.GILI01001945.1~~GILI01001945.1.p1  ORF type:complete len:303 (-),score=75.90 GILI01001945.1:379-1287(-)
MSSSGPSFSRRPANTPFKQQRLKAWQPILTPAWVISSFAIVGIVFIPVGVVLLVTSQSVVEAISQYDNKGSTGSYFMVDITVPKEMKAPVFFYYQLENYYQNHRRYVKSRSDSQLRGTDYTNPSDLKTDCDPLYKDASGNVLNPCGLIAQSFFNDTFSLYDSSSNQITVYNHNIAWESDIKYKFAKSKTQTQSPDVTNEHFIVWMRTAALPNFRKLWGRIENNIPAGTYKVNVTNNYPVSSFKGRKFVVLSTTTWLGGRNDFLGIAYLVVGSVCLALSLLFLWKHKTSGRRLGDTSHLKFNH